VEVGRPSGEEAGEETVVMVCWGEGGEGVVVAWVGVGLSGWGEGVMI
jgi:hypothetical protein